MLFFSFIRKGFSLIRLLVQLKPGIVSTNDSVENLTLFKFPSKN